MSSSRLRTAPQVVVEPLEPRLLLSAVDVGATTMESTTAAAVVEALSPDDALPIVQPSLDLHRRQSAKVAPHGGGVIAESARGDVFELQLQGNSIYDTTEVSLTPLVSLEGLPFVSGLLAAVDLQPDGLQLMRGGELRISLAEDWHVSEIAVFAYDGKSYEMWMVPFHVSDGQIVLSLGHFSGYGVAAATTAEVQHQAQIVTTPERMASQRMHTVVRQILQRETPDGGLAEPTDTEWASLRDALQAWYRNGVLPQLQLAVTDPSILGCAVRGYLRWEKAIVHDLDRIMDVDDSLAGPQMREGLALVELGMRNAVEVFVRRAVEERNPAWARNIIRLERDLALLGFTDTDNALHDRLESLLRFELDIDTRISFQWGPPQDAQQQFQGAGLADGSPFILQWDGASVVGEGVLWETQFTSPWYVSHTSRPGEVSMRLDFDLPDPLVDRCGPVRDVEPWVQTSTVIEDVGSHSFTFQPPEADPFTLPETGWTWSTWQTLFHLDQILAGAGIGFVFEDWSLVEGPDVFARRSLNASTTSATMNETWTLRHAPQADWGEITRPSQVANGSFGAGLGGWSTGGEGTVTAGRDPRDPDVHRAVLATQSPVTLSQTVTAPTGTLSFSYEFLTPGGQLAVLLDSHLLALLQAPAEPLGQWSEWTMHVPALDLPDEAVLEFRFDGPVGSQLGITNVGLNNPHVGDDVGDENGGDDEGDDGAPAEPEAVLIGPGHARFLRYPDVSGTMVTVRLNGGVGEVMLNGSNLQAQQQGAGIVITGEGIALGQIRLTGTTARSTLRIDVVGGATTTVGDIHVVGGAMRAIHAGQAVLTGDLTIAQSIQQIVLGGVTGDQSVIAIGLPLRSNQQVAMNLGAVSGLSIESQTPIRLLQATGWVDNPGALDRIAAPSLGRLVVAGDFAAGLLLTDATSRQGLGNARIAGQVTGGTWEIVSAVGTIRSNGGMADAWVLETPAHVQTIHAGQAPLGGTLSAGTFGVIRTGGLFSAAVEATGANAHGVSILNLSVGPVDEGRISAAGAVNRITARDWTGGGIDAAWIASLVISGDGRAGLAGDLSTMVTLTGQNAAGWSLGRLTTRGAIVDSQIRAAGSINQLNASDLIGSIVHAGIHPAAGGLPTSAAVVNASAQIRDVNLRGGEWAGSYLAAPSIGRLRNAWLQSVNRLSPGTPFGVAAGQIGRMQLTINSERIAERNVTDADQEDDWILRII